MAIFAGHLNCAQRPHIAYTLAYYTYTNGNYSWFCLCRVKVPKWRAGTCTKGPTKDSLRQKKKKHFNKNTLLPEVWTTTINFKVK